MLHQSALVLKSVTFAQMVEIVVKVLVNLARGTVFDQKASKHTKATHPHHLTRLRHVSAL